MLHSTRPKPPSGDIMLPLQLTQQATRLNLLQHDDERLLPGKPLAMCLRAVCSDAAKVV